MKTFFNFLTTILTEKNKILTELYEDKESIYLEYINKALIKALNQHTPKSFVENLPQIPQNLVTQIKTHIVQNNQFVELKEIIQTFINSVEPINLLNLFENIPTLKIKYGKKRKKILGNYSVKKNIIYIFNNKYSTLSHEFLHMASSKTIDNINLCGFSVGNQYGTFFNGLNEGFTEILHQRIFHEKSITYKNNIIICQCLELMFKNPKEIETAYFNNDIDFIYKTFLNYGTKEEFAYLCQKLDYFATKDNEQTEVDHVLDFLYSIISRHNEKEKLDAFIQIIDQNKPQTLTNKIKTLAKKIC